MIITNREEVIDKAFGAQCADGAETGTVRDIAVLTRVGRPTCFVIEILLAHASRLPKPSPLSWAWKL